MTKKEVFDLVTQGKEITKRSIMKFKYGRLVRGSYFDYSVDGLSITEKQFNAIQDNFQLERLGEKCTMSMNVYKIFTL